MTIDQFTISRHGFIFKSYRIFKDKTQVLSVKSTGFLRQLIIYNMKGEELMRIKRPMALFSMKFKMIVNGEVRAEIYKENSITKNNLSIDTAAGLYFVEGNFWANEFTIENDKEAIAKISRKTFSRDKYGVAILHGQDTLFILGIVMTIELMIRVKNARRNA